MNKTGLIALTAALSCVLLTACGESAATSQQPSTTTTQTTQQTQETNVTFVAADKTNWDKEVNIGEYSYTLAVTLNADGTVSLDATCTGKAQAASSQQGMGMGMGMGMGGQEDSEPAAEEPAMSDSEKAAQNFSLTGSWTKEEGYGFTITIDGYTTKTNFDKASSRHIFYAVIKGSDLIQFQGKDTAFRKEMAADYEDFEVRDAQWSFYGTGTTMTGNASSTKVHLEKDGTANALTQSGSSPSYARGTWSENPDKSLTVVLDGVQTAAYCDIAGKEGYRLTFNDMTMYCSVSGAEIAYTDVDFDGETVLTLQCAEGDYTIELTEKGFANIYKSGEKDSTGTYTVENGVYTIKVDDKEYVSDGETITLEFESGDNCCGGGETESRTFNLDGSKPEGAPAGEASSEGGEASSQGGEGENAGEGEGEGEASSEGGEASSQGGEASSQGGDGAPEA